MQALLTVSFKKNTIVFGSQSYASPTANLMLVLAYMVWARLTNSPAKECCVTKQQLVARIDTCRAANQQDPMTEENIRQTLRRILIEFKENKLSFVVSEKVNAGPFLFKVSATDIRSDLSIEELRDYLRIPRKQVFPSTDINFEQADLVDALIEFNESQRCIREGLALDIESNHASAQVHSDPTVMTSLMDLSRHPREDIRELTNFILFKIHMKEYKHDLAHAQLKSISKAIAKVTNLDPYVELKYKLYCAWLALRLGDYDKCGIVLTGIDQHDCHDRQLLALYCNLSALVIKDTAVKHFRSGQPDPDFDDHVHAQIAIHYHQIALHAQMQANDMDGIQNTCTSMANTYFSFAHRYAGFRSDKMEQMGFKWLITSVAMSNDYLAGGFVVNNIITLAKSLLDSKYDFKWLKAYSAKMSRSSHSVLINYERLEDFLEDALKPDKTAMNKREVAYLHSLLAQAYMKSGDKINTIKNAKIARELFVQLKYFEHVHDMDQLLADAVASSNHPPAKPGAFEM